MQMLEWSHVLNPYSWDSEESGFIEMPVVVLFQPGEQVYCQRFGGYELTEVDISKSWFGAHR